MLFTTDRNTNQPDMMLLVVLSWLTLIIQMFLHNSFARLQYSSRNHSPHTVRRSYRIHAGKFVTRPSPPRRHTDRYNVHIAHRPADEGVQHTPNITVVCTLLYASAFRVAQQPDPLKAFVYIVCVYIIQKICRARPALWDETWLDWQYYAAVAISIAYNISFTRCFLRRK